MSCEEKEACTNIVLVVKIFYIIVLSIVSDIYVPLDNIVGPVPVTLCNDLCMGSRSIYCKNQGSLLRDPWLVLDLGK